MNVPTHPAGTDDPAPAQRPNRRIVLGAVALVLVLASLHLLRAALG